MKFFTIGVYGWSEVSFFRVLQQMEVDTFCDIRWRRGVRGSEYVFANSARLQRRLADLGIRYLHLRELAPHPALRQRQTEADKAAGTTKRRRTTLGQAFIDGYRKHSLAAFDSGEFFAQLGPGALRIVLFCVERDPAACHRSLLAERLQQELGVEVIHLLPEPSRP